MIDRSQRTQRRAWWQSDAPRRNPALPLVLAGTMAFAASVTGAVEPADASSLKRSPTPRPAASDRGKTVREAIVDARTAVAASAASAAAAVRAAVAPPATYTVVAGDTVSDIAATYGLSTPNVLALNGLSWSSTIYPGQVLKLTSSGPVAPTTAPTPVAPELVRHTIATGDTVSAVAEAYGVTTEAVLAANGLGWSSLIFPGQTLVIPTTGTAPAAVVVVEDVVEVTIVEEAPAEEAAVEAASAGDVAGLAPEMAENASIIIAVGRELGVDDYGIVIALATAAQESTLRNLDWGDRDSLGLFQQRPSTGWGTPDELLDPVHATRLFFGGPGSPNVGTLGLLDIEGWSSMPLTVAAQAVQISGHPDAYAKWEASAWAWLEALG